MTNLYNASSRELLSLLELFVMGEPALCETEGMRECLFNKLLLIHNLRKGVAGTGPSLDLKFVSSLDLLFS